MKKATLLTFLSTFLALYNYAQIGFRPMIVRPIGEFGAVMKPSPSIEVSGAEFFTYGHFRSNWSANLNWFRPRLDTFRVYSVVTDGYSGTTVYPGTESPKSYVTLNGNFGVDYSPVEDGEIFPYVGLDVIVGFYRYRDQYNIPEVKSMDESVMGVLVGGRAKMGVEYQFAESSALFLQYSFTKWLNLEPPFIVTAWDLGLGIRYEF